MLEVEELLVKVVACVATCGGLVSLPAVAEVEKRTVGEKGQRGVNVVQEQEERKKTPNHKFVMGYWVGGTVGSGKRAFDQVVLNFNHKFAMGLGHQPITQGSAHLNCILLDPTQSRY